jgi:hypothetical protein
MLRRSSRRVPAPKRAVVKNVHTTTSVASSAVGMTRGSGMPPITTFTEDEIAAARMIWEDLPDDAKDAVFDQGNFWVMHELLEEAHRRERITRLGERSKVSDKQGNTVMQWGPAYHTDDWVKRIGCKTS